MHAGIPPLPFARRPPRQGRPPGKADLLPPGKADHSPPGKADPPWQGRPPLARRPLARQTTLARQTPLARRSPLARQTHLPAQCLVGIRSTSSGMHPTGMQFLFFRIFGNPGGLAPPHGESWIRPCIGIIVLSILDTLNKIISPPPRIQTQCNEWRV